MSDAILTLNAGSSSIKFALYETAPLRRLLHGQVEGLGTAPHFLARDPAGAVSERRWADASLSHEALLGELLDWVEAHRGSGRLVAVGHRVVHGGASFGAPEPVSPALLAALEALVPLAPLHQPHNLAPIHAIAAARPGLPQVACFDTAFHHAMPAVATRLALPRRITEQGVRRYGFHGLSYEYIAGALGEAARGRVIVAHLGNGASLCAMRDGVSVETTMGFTALDGLMMGTRCGSLDPGVVLYLLQQGMSAREVEHLLYSESGLLGVSGLSPDMRTLLASEAPAAAEAVALFVHRIAREAAALAGAMGGLDAFVFTAGIGEHAAPVRAMVAERLAWLGAALDPAANAAHARVISTPASRLRLLVVPTDEEAMIARHTLASLGAALARA